MDIATLGLEVRSDQVEKGTASLDRLSRAASRAQAAAMGVATGSRQAAAGSASVASSSSNAAGALDREAAAARRAQQALERQATASRAANDNARRMGGSMSGLAAQFQDIGVTAAMGMNPAIIALQQGTQIAGQMEFAMQGGAKATDVLGTAFRSLFSPLTFITIALTALAAAGLQLVDWTALAGSALNGLASILQTVAPYAAMAAAGLALIYAPAIIGGIVSVIALLGRLSVAAVTAAATMAAANPAAAFVLGITAAVAAANIFRDDLAQIFGRDIVADARNAVNFIIGAFVGAFNAIRATWGALPAALGDLVYSTANTVIGGVESMVNTVAGLIDGFIAKINGAMKSLPFGLGEQINIGSIGSFSLPRLANPNAGAAASAVDTARGAFADAQGTDYVGMVTDVIGRSASAASSKLKELAKDITAVDEKSKKKRGGGKSDADKYQDIIAGAEKYIRSQELELRALGMTARQAAVARHEQDLLNQAYSAGIKVTEAQAVALGHLAERMADAELRTKAAKATQDAWNEAGRGFGGVLKGLIEGTTSWKDAIQQAIPIFLKLLNDMNLAQGGKGIFGGGFFQNLIGGLLGIGFASGGYTGNRGAGQVAGVVHGQEYVFSAAATRKLGVGNLDAMHRAAKGYQSGGYVTPAMPRIQSPANDQPLRIEVVSRFDADGGFESAVERTSRPISQTEAREASDKRVGAYNDQQRRGGAAVNSRYYSGLKRRS